MAIVYLNGDYLPDHEAKVSVLDRGFLFSDAVYEVIPVFEKKLIHAEEHLERLEQSLAAIQLPLTINHKDWITICNKLVELNQFKEADQCIYIQITRGPQPVRSHPIPTDIEPTLLAMCQPSPKKPSQQVKKGFSAITTPDKRRKDCYIKSTALMPNVLAFQKAIDQGCNEAILVRDGNALEGTSSNLFMVKDGTLITPPVQPQILAGITRRKILELAKQNNIPTEERSIKEVELSQADEIWLTGSAKEIYPIVSLNKQAVGNGQPGPIWKQLQAIYQEEKEIT